MLRKSTIFVCTICLLVFSGAATAQMDLPAKDVISYLVGSWTTEYEFPGVGQVREEAAYKKGKSGNTLHLVFKVLSGGKEIDSGEGTIIYDPKTDTVSSSVKSKVTGATYKSWDVKREGNTAWMEGGSDGDPMMSKYRIKIVTDSKDSHTWSMYLPDGDGWKELMTTTYNRGKK